VTVDTLMIALASKGHVVQHNRTPDEGREVVCSACGFTLDGFALDAVLCDPADAPKLPDCKEPPKAAPKGK
jgi:hypothetical protein